MVGVNYFDKRINVLYGQWRMSTYPLPERILALNVIRFRSQKKRRGL